MSLGLLVRQKRSRIKTIKNMVRFKVVQALRINFELRLLKIYNNFAE